MNNSPRRLMVVMDRDVEILGDLIEKDGTLPVSEIWWTRFASDEDRAGRGRKRKVYTWAHRRLDELERLGFIEEGQPVLVAHEDQPARWTSNVHLTELGRSIYPFLLAVVNRTAEGARVSA